MKHSSNRGVGNASSSHVFEGGKVLGYRSEMSEGSAMERKFSASRWVR